MMIRKKTVYSLLLLIVLTTNMILPVLAEQASAPESIGMMADPIEIHTAQDLDNVRNNMSGSYILMADIDLGVSPWNEGNGWIPIGTEINPFTGVFDGNDHVIYNLTINRSDLNEAGLFGVTGNSTNPQLFDLTLFGVSIAANDSTGGLAGRAGGPIDNCSVSGVVVGGYMVGGLVGKGEKYILNSTSNTAVRGTDRVGGLVGSMGNYTITDCAANGTVLADDYGGGLVGYTIGSVRNSHASVEVTGNYYLGGLIGSSNNMDREIFGCSASGLVTSGVIGEKESYTGGLIGWSISPVTQSQAHGDVYGAYETGGLVGHQSLSHIMHSRADGHVTGNHYVGGLVGNLQQCDVRFSSASGHISGAAYVGGLVGRQDPGTGLSTIDSCTAMGNVSAGSGIVGGLVGRISGPATTTRVTNSRAYGSASAINYAGGLAGFSDGLIQNSNAYGSAEASNAGGLVGAMSELGMVLNCHAFGDVSGPSTLGGLVGYTSSPIACSSAHGTVSAGGSNPESQNFIGGLVGRTSDLSSISSSYATGNVSGYWQVGGLVGDSNGDIWNSYALGSVYGHSYIGGLCGTAFGSDPIVKDIFHCYSAGSVFGSSSGTFIGGLIGYTALAVNLTNSYYDMNTSGQPDTGVGDPRTTAEMITAYPSDTIYTDWSLDIWRFDPDSEYPWHQYNKPPHIPVDRIAGSNRYTTAVRISEMGWGDCQGGSDTVILSVGTNFPDSLAGVPLAYRLHAPILLTAKDTLPASTLSEIQRLGASKVIILGGTGAVSETVVDQVEAISGVAEIRRIAGSNRYDTAMQIAMESSLDGYDTIYLASGLDFPDALSAAAFAAQRGRPILLTGKTALSASVKTLLENKTKIRTVVIVGGTSAISDDVVAELNSMGLDVQRIAGANRYETSLHVANAAWQDGQEIFLATGTNFPDALAGGVLAALNRGGVVLVRSTATTVPDSIIDFIDSHSITSGRILGGLSAVSGEMEFNLSTLLSQ